MLKATPILLLTPLLAACGSTVERPNVAHVLAKPVKHCAAGEQLGLGSNRISYVAVAAGGAVVYQWPHGAVRARFGPRNANGYPTVFGVVGAVVGRSCAPRWYHVQVPLKPNGVTGYVHAGAVRVQTVKTRITVSVSQRRLRLYRRGRLVLSAAVAVGAPATPTPTGHFYVNQLLVPADTAGPFGPGAVGISAFSNVLTGWTQGGPVAIHGTNEPWSIGHAVSNGCIRLSNPTAERVFHAAVAGTPVIIVP